jgi:hypothetical protein
MSKTLGSVIEMTSPKDKARKGLSGMDDPEQSARFIEAARKLGCDESEEAFERVFDRIVPRRAAGDPLPQHPVPAKVRAKAPKRRTKSPA